MTVHIGPDQVTYLLTALAVLALAVLILAAFVWRLHLTLRDVCDETLRDICFEIAQLRGEADQALQDLPTPARSLAQALAAARRDATQRRHGGVMGGRSHGPV